MAVPRHGCTLVFITISFLGCLYSGSLVDAKNCTRSFEVEASDWDQIVLSLQWPFTACKKMDCSTKLDTWTIHGLWPGYSSKRDCPTGCRDVPFDNSVKSDQSVHKYWPDLRRSDPSTFWKYEWGKHGQCALDSSKIKDCKDYFRRAVKLRKTYSPGRVMENNGFKKSNSKSYETKKVNDALRKAFGKTPRLRCYLKGGKYYLGEVHICFSKSMVLKSCNNRDQCGADDNYSDVTELGGGATYTNCKQSLYYPRST